MDPESDYYFQTVSAYIHLNPIRARGLLREGAKLESYPWSSYPSYLKAGRKRPTWLEVKRVLGELSLTDSAAGRRSRPGDTGVIGGRSEGAEQNGSAQTGIGVACAPENIGSERLDIEQVGHGA